MEKITSTIEFAKKYPEAFSALPEVYRADDCLEYYIDESEIRCQPKDKDLHALGRWTGMYDEVFKFWQLRLGLKRF